MGIILKTGKRLAFAVSFLGMLGLLTPADCPGFPFTHLGETGNMGTGGTGGSGGAGGVAGSPSSGLYGGGTGGPGFSGNSGGTGGTGGDGTWTIGGGTITNNGTVYLGGLPGSQGAWGNQGLSWGGQGGDGGGYFFLPSYFFCVEKMGFWRAKKNLSIY